MGRRTLLILFLFHLGFVAIGQSDSTNDKTAQLAKENLTYFWTGRACPSFKETESKYGFKIKCKGSLLTRRIRKHNEKVEKRINKVYGDNWLEENKQNFYYSF